MIQSGSRPCVLLVEDDEQDAFLFEKVLENSAPELHIRHETSAREALAHLIADPDHITLIVLDLKLVGEDGVWMLEQLSQHETFKSLPVIVFSGDPERLGAASSQFSNVVSCVRKPESLAEYESALHIVLAILSTTLEQIES